MPKLRATHLFGSAMVTVTLLAGLNFALGRAASRLPPQQLLRRIDATAGDARFIFVGDSQIEADADPVAFSSGCARPKDWGPSINVGLGATKACDHCLIVEYLLARAPRADTVFYGFYDELVTQPVPARFQDLGGNRALAFVFPRRAAELLYPDDRIRGWLLRGAAKLPMVAERVGIWAKVERLRRRVAAVGLPPVAENRFGRVSDFAAIEPAEPAAFERSLTTTVHEGRPFSYPTRELMRLCAERNLKFYLIAMPVQASHRARFYTSTAWSAYRAYVRQTTELAGGRFVDAADWVADDAFEDLLHTNPTGARIFSTRLAQEICGEAQAPK